MSNKQDRKTEIGAARVYQIRVKGQLGADWADWFEGLTITQEADGDSLISGPVVDQAALYGLLKKVRDLGLPLIAVNRMPLDSENLAGAGDMLDDPALPYRSK